MPSRGRIPLLVVVGALAALAVGALVLLPSPQVGRELVWPLPFLAAYGAGVVACRSQPDNLAARRLLLFGALALSWLVVSLVFERAGVRSWFVAANTVVQMVGLLMATSIAALLAVYPDGRHVGRAPGRVVRALVGTSLGLPLLLLLCRERTLGAPILQWSTDGAPSVASPWQLAPLAWLDGPASFLMQSSLGLVPAVGVALLALRFRRLDETQRARVAWPLLAALSMVLCSVSSVLVEPAREVLDAASGVALVLLPVSLGVGIVRPRLFDAMGAVRRTLAFTGLSALVLGLYVTVAWLLGLAVGRDNLTVAVVVAVIAALALDPVRRRLVARAARVVYGEVVSRDELLRGLGETLEHTLDLVELTAAIATTAREGLGAAWVWLEVDGTDPVVAGNERPGDTPSLVARLHHGDADLGRIVCGPLVRGRPTAQTRELLATLARQAGLALTNARLVGELEAHLTELAASRKRLVRAEETARRKLERDLHDGSQQEIAALMTRIALARSQLRRDDVVELGRTLETLQGDAQHALTNLREIASGIHMSVLADRGLVEAIEARVARLPIRVSVTCGPGVRDGELSDSVEGAAYFLVCEALANTLKHGGAERAEVGLRLESDALHIDVSDDGCGFDPTDVRRRGGLAGLADRLAALGGSLDVASRPGAGTRVAGVLPSRP